jgi:hypothetical protein
MEGGMSAGVEAVVVRGCVERTIFGLVGCVFVGYAGRFEGEADELAASWDTGPVEQLVWWVGAGFLIGGHGVEVLDRCYAVSGWD